MKKMRAAALILGTFLLFGCCWAAQAAKPNYEPARAENGCLKPIPPDAISQEMHDILQNAWDAWASLDGEQRMLSSHTPGYCTRGFDSWADCEAFLGFSIPNPLEECAWLEQGTYVAMPIGYMDAPRVEATWYGTSDGHVEWIMVEAGYRKDALRVTLSAALYGDPADSKSRDSGWTTEFERLDYLEQADSAPLQITSNSTDTHLANRAYQAQGDILYCLSVVGETGEQAQIQTAFDQVVDFFFPAAI